MCGTQHRMMELYICCTADCSAHACWSSHAGSNDINWLHWSACILSHTCLKIRIFCKFWACTEACRPSIAWAGKQAAKHETRQNAPVDAKHASAWWNQAKHTSRCKAWNHSKRTSRCRYWWGARPWWSVSQLGLDSHSMFWTSPLSRLPDLWTACHTCLTCDCLTNTQHAALIDNNDCLQICYLTQSGQVIDLRSLPCKRQMRAFYTPLLPCKSEWWHCLVAQLHRVFSAAAAAAACCCCLAYVDMVLKIVIECMYRGTSASMCKFIP